MYNDLIRPHVSTSFILRLNVRLVYTNFKEIKCYTGTGSSAHRTSLVLNFALTMTALQWTCSCYSETLSSMRFSDSDFFFRDVIAYFSLMLWGSVLRSENAMLLCYGNVSSTYPIFDLFLDRSLCNILFLFNMNLEHYMWENQVTFYFSLLLFIFFLKFLYWATRNRLIFSCFSIVTA